MNGYAIRWRRATMVIAGLVAVASMVAVLAITGRSESHAATDSGHAAMTSPRTSKEVAFGDAMRKLWEDHITWTRLAIVEFAGNLPGLPATEHRLLRNQTDIGDAIKPFYGAAAGSKLTKLLKAHITGAVAVLEAAKSGDAGEIAKAKSAWYENARQIADFLATANPDNWPRAEMRKMMRTHLNQTLKEAVDYLTGRFQASVHDYDAVHRHILAMADNLSAGIIAQFPGRFH
jgi:hypothetical protein